MDKDVVYIEPDDDITTVVEQIGESEAEAVAIVAPKRSSLLQSAVNLKLLRKRADSAGKDLSLVTTDNVVNNIASRLGLATAPDLKSEPSVPEAAAGSKGDLPETTISEQEFSGPEETAAVAAKTEADKSRLEALKAKAKPKPKAKGKKGSRFNVPNFDKFKKRIFLGGGALLLLIIGWWVATFLLPTATVTLQAQSENLDLSGEMTVDTTQENIDLEKGVLPATSQEMTKTLVTSFQPSGEKEVGDRATGTITVENCKYTDSFTLSKGTGFTASSGHQFQSTQAVAVPGAEGNFVEGCTQPGTADVPVVAAERGTEYNLSPRSYTIDNEPDLEAQGGQMSGGTDETVSVVTQADINQARQQLLKNERPTARQELLGRFGDDVHILEPSFTQKVQSANANPPAGSESDTGQLTLEVRYFALAISQEDLQTFLNYQAEDKLEKEGETKSEVVEENLDDLNLEVKSKPAPNRQVYSFNGTVQIGPKVDKPALGEELAGKEYGRALEDLKARPHVTDAAIDLSPFWVFTLPDNPERIEIELNLSQTE